MRNTLPFSVRAKIGTHDALKLLFILMNQRTPPCSFQANWLLNFCSHLRTYWLTCACFAMDGFYCSANPLSATSAVQGAVAWTLLDGNSLDVNASCGSIWWSKHLAAQIFWPSDRNASVSWHIRNFLMHTCHFRKPWFETSRFTTFHSYK